MTVGKMMFFGGIAGTIIFLVIMFVILGNRNKNRKKCIEKIQKTNI
ncbi:MAG: hypothetical protein MJ105_08305 [Lachnospiraceae bacterium]|nr:hypothetical protein [Lachnospiraceae bacterium]